MDIQPVTLEGHHVRLEPLSLEHLPDSGDASQRVEPDAR